MKVPFLAVCVTLAALSVASQSISAAQSQTPPAINVMIDNYAFKAPVVTIPAGATVVFKNLDDDPHTVTSEAGLFDSKGLAQGDTWAHRFVKPGTYKYYCKVHPYMTGTVIVKESN